MLIDKKVQQFMKANNIERDNFTLVMRLRDKVEELNRTVKEQGNIILTFKKDVKATKINEMEVQIQHLNDQNKRLLLFLQELKTKTKNHAFPTSKKNQANAIKQEQHHRPVRSFKCSSKTYDILKENQFLRKELLNLKVNENLLKKRKSTINDRSSIFLEKNLIDYEKLSQKMMDLEAERTLMIDKLKSLQNKVSELTRRNQELEKINHQQILRKPEQNMSL